jgi:hypothetical protein
LIDDRRRHVRCVGSGHKRLRLKTNRTEHIESATSSFISSVSSISSFSIFAYVVDGIGVLRATTTRCDELQPRR